MAIVDPQLKEAIGRSFLADVAPELVGRLLAQTRLRDLVVGQVFIGALAPYRCGILVDGLARAYVVRPDGSETTLRRAGPGSAVGIKAIVGRRNDATVAALTDCVFLPLDAESIVRLGRQHVDLAWAIAEEEARRLDDTQHQLESALHGTIAQRAAGLLLDLLIEGEAGVSISVEGLADRIGASREATGRALAVLAEAGLIRRLRARIMVVDIRGLERQARTSDDADPLQVDFTTRRPTR